MTEAPAFVRRATVVLRPDPSRVISRLFLPGQELLARGISRADAVIQRVLAMTDEAVADTLAATVRRFSDRHDDLAGVFAEHFALVAHRLPATATASPERRDLIGAYFTQEYSVEAAALFNPSIVAHPDQTGLAAGELRFIMSVRAVGEGHISCIKFRTGVVTDHNVRIADRHQFGCVHSFLWLRTDRSLVAGSFYDTSSGGTPELPTRPSTCDFAY